VIRSSSELWIDGIWLSYAQCNKKGTAPGGNSGKSGYRDSYERKVGYPETGFGNGLGNQSASVAKATSNPPLFAPTVEPNYT
jgi:hypothetical protein